MTYMYTHIPFTEVFFFFLPVCGAKKKTIIFMVILYMYDLAYGLKLISGDRHTWLIHNSISFPYLA